MPEDARTEEARSIDEARRWAEARRADLAKRAWNFAANEQNARVLAALDPTALRTLLGAAANASCLREVEILLLYQHGRDRMKWPTELVKGIEAELEKAVKDAKEETTKARRELPSALDAAEAMIAASWLGFLVRLHRYHYEAAREKRDGGRR